MRHNVWSGHNFTAGVYPHKHAAWLGELEAAACLVSYCCPAALLSCRSGALLPCCLQSL